MKNLRKAVADSLVELAQKGIIDEEVSLMVFGTVSTEITAWRDKVTEEIYEEITRWESREGVDDKLYTLGLRRVVEVLNDSDVLEDNKDGSLADVIQLRSEEDGEIR